MWSRGRYSGKEECGRQNEERERGAVKGFLKLLAVGVAGIVLLGLLLIVVIEVQTKRSQKQVEELVARFPPETPFTTVVQQLGSATQTFTNAEDIVVMGSRKEESFAANKVLHMFSHRGTPFRWILIYTDKDSERVVYAAWSHM
jgi:hypothetical protein